MVLSVSVAAEDCFTFVVFQDCVAVCVSFLSIRCGRIVNGV